MMQEILYNSQLTEKQIDYCRGALHELDQIIKLPHTAKAQQQMVEKGGMKVVEEKQVTN
jgi:hypothetical protein